MKPQFSRKMASHATPITIVVPLHPQKIVEYEESINNQGENVHVKIERGENPSRNRNRGAAKAKTPLIAFINGHTGKNPWYTNMPQSQKTGRCLLSL